MEGVFPFGAGHGACANPIFDVQKLWVQAGPALEPYCVYLDPCSAALAPYLCYFRVFVAFILDLDISWLLRFGFVGLGFWSWAFQGCCVLALFVFTLDLGHFSVVKFWVLAQRCQRKQYIDTKKCNSLLAALLML